MAMVTEIAEMLVPSITNVAWAGFHPSVVNVLTKRLLSDERGNQCHWKKHWAFSGKGQRVAPQQDYSGDDTEHKAPYSSPQGGPVRARLVRSGSSITQAVVWARMF